MVGFIVLIMMVPKNTTDFKRFLDILTIFCQNLEAAIFQAMASLRIIFPFTTIYIAVKITPITLDGILLSLLVPGRPPSNKYVSHT